MALSPLVLVLAAAAFRRRRLQTALARLAPGQMVVYRTIARTRHP